jgi:hypothetical protein
VVLEEQEHLAVLREDPHRQALLRAGLGALLVTGALAGFRVVQVAGEVDDLPRDAVIGPDLQYASRQHHRRHRRQSHRSHSSPLLIAPA